MKELWNILWETFIRWFLGTVAALLAAGCGALLILWLLTHGA